MPLNNSDYDKLMREYDERRASRQQLISERTQELYARIPRLYDIKEEIGETAVQTTMALLSGDAEDTAALRRRVTELEAEQVALLQKSGIPSDYLNPPYVCPDCKDTGYIGGKRCHCLVQASLNLRYQQSNLAKLPACQGLCDFKTDYYSDRQIPELGVSCRENATQALNTCRDFVNKFSEKCDNLLLYGDAGVGKTFLSTCMATELIQKGFSVVYLTAYELFQIFEKTAFDHDKEMDRDYENIFECELLIIDDLGTELPNGFTVSQLFQCINERLLREKSTVISTNLTLGRLAETYTERTFSRISSNYTIIKLVADDIRIQKMHCMNGGS